MLTSGLWNQGFAWAYSPLALQLLLWRSACNWDKVKAKNRHHDTPSRTACVRRVQNLVRSGISEASSLFLFWTSGSFPLLHPTAHLCWNFMNDCFSFSEISKGLNCRWFKALRGIRILSSLFDLAHFFSLKKKKKGRMESFVFWFVFFWW